jgi:glucose-1-phosphate thymidylyltransferase
VFVVLGDTICEYDVQAVVKSPYSMIGVRKVDDPGIWCCGNWGGRIYQPCGGKTHIPRSNMALVGLYKIKESEEMFQCLENNIRQGLRSHGEYSLTDALDCMIKLGADSNRLKLRTGLIAVKKRPCWNQMLTLLRNLPRQRLQTI